MATHRLAPLGLPESPPFGHQDPAWRPDGTQLLYVRNGRDGSRGAPAIWRYDPATKKTSRFSQPGYSQPAFSPDGRYLAATKISTLGTDVVILDARTANELLRVTIDGRSWGAAWSPDGTQIAFLHLAGSTTDLQVATIVRGANADCRSARPSRSRSSAASTPRAGPRGGVRPHPQRRRRRPPRGLRPARRRDRAVPRPARPPHGGGRHRSLCRHRSHPGARTGGLARRSPRHRTPCPAPRRGRRAAAAAIKPNLAFFEAYGSAGIAALERVLAARPPGVLVIADAKRGDVETTVARQAAAVFDALGADAVTVSPYLGLSALTGFLARADRFAYVLCRTSNPGAGELQDLVVAADPSIGAPAEALHRRLARRVAAAGLEARAGLVVGATAPPSWRRSGALFRASPFSSRASGPRARPRRSSCQARRRRLPPARGRGGGAAGERLARIAAAASRRPSDGESADPGERVAEAARSWAATLAARS